MRILGIDPGLRLTGYGVIDCKAGRPILVDGGVIRLNVKQSIADRLVELESELESIIAEHQPNYCAVELIYSNVAHPRTAILMAHARGVILMVARRRGLIVREFAANRIKLATVGHGHAQKGQMQRAIQAIWNLPEPPRPPDVADALAVAVCCGNALTSIRQSPPTGLEMLLAKKKTRGRKGRFDGMDRVGSASADAKRQDVATVSTEADPTRSSVQPKQPRRRSSNLPPA